MFSLKYPHNEIMLISRIIIYYIKIKLLLKPFSLKVFISWKIVSFFDKSNFKSYLLTFTVFIYCLTKPFRMIYQCFYLQNQFVISMHITLFNTLNKFKITMTINKLQIKKCKANSKQSRRLDSKRHFHILLVILVSG